jgi:hypothetical protein
MSLSRKGEVLHKTGRSSPLATNQTRRERYAGELARTLHQALEPPEMSIKTIMNWTSAGERTVKGWLSASSGPRGDHLIELMKASDLVFARVLTLAEREAVDQKTLRALRGPLSRLNRVIERLIGE